MCRVHVRSCLSYIASIRNWHAAPLIHPCTHWGISTSVIESYSCLTCTQNYIETAPSPVTWTLSSLESEANKYIS